MANIARRVIGATLLASLVLAFVPHPAQAWSVHRVDPMPDGVIAAWTTDLVPQALPTTDLLALPGAAACALGDVTGDGIADLAVVVQAASGAVSLEARAGPGFEEVVWRVQTTLERVLECAPDLDLDGTLDPIIRTLGDATADATGTAGVATDSARSIVQQTLDGASGAALVGRVDPQTATGAAANGLGVAQNATSVLLPAAEGALALLQGSASQATAALPVPLPPLGPLEGGLGGLTATATQAAQLDILDATGAVTSTISIDQAGIEPLALAPVQLSGALPDVAVLSQVTGPVGDVAAGVPELALYAADGTLAWSTQLPAATGIPLLVPNVGDLNLDGVGDMVVTTVEQGVSTVPGATYSVLSGVDGSILFDSGPAVSGLLSALPLGELPGGPALLQAAMAPTAGALELSALGANGQVIWSATVDKLAEPINTVIDPYSGDLLGFTDLTGDGIADIAVSSVGSSGELAVQALDGVTGEVSWNATLPDASTVIPVVIGASQVLDDVAGEVRDAAGDAVNRSTEVADQVGLGDALDGVEDAAVGQASMLLAIGHDSTDATLTLLDGVTGEVAWSATAALPDVPVADLTAEVAGDLTGDLVQDLIVTARLGTSALPASSTGAASSAGSGDGAVVAAVSGASGETVWSESTSSANDGTELDFEGEFGPRAESAGPADSNDAPGVAPWALGLGVVALTALLRRRR